jgi:hypothetical protein
MTVSVRVPSFAIRYSPTSPTAFALTKLTKADEKRIAELVKRAVS